MPPRSQEEARAANAKRSATYELLVEGVYIQKVFRTMSADGTYEVEVWNLVVAPGTRSAELVLPGTAVFTARTGTVEVLISEESSGRIGHKAPFVLKEGTALQLRNTQESRPSNLRVTLLHGVEQ